MNYHLRLYQFVCTSLFAPLLLCIVITIFKLPDQVNGFHLSFGHRLIKSASNPQLNPASTLIRPIECRNSNNHTEVGICMFSIDCMQNKGVPLSVCKHNYFVGTCCRLPDYNNFVGIVYDLRETEVNQLLEARKGLLPAPQLASTSPEHLSPPAPLGASLPPGPSTTSGTLTSQTVASFAPSKGDEEAEKPLEARYIISSTSLFPPAPTRQPAAAGGQSISSSHNERQSDVEPKPTSKQEAVQPASAVAESARNVDGIAQTLLVSSNNPLGQHKQQIVVPSELDSYHVQQHPPQSNQMPSSLAPTLEASSSSMGQSSAYEMIKDSSSATSVDRSDLVSGILNQPAAQQQFNVVDQPTDTTKESAKPIEAPQKLAPTKVPTLSQDSVYLLDDHQQQRHKNQHQTIVFANNHQLASIFKSQPEQLSVPAQSTSSSTTVGQQQPSSGSPSTTGVGSDQEFTLSSSGATSAFSEQQTGLPTTISLNLAPSTAAAAAASTQSGSSQQTPTSEGLTNKSSQDLQPQTTPPVQQQPSSTNSQAPSAAASTHVDLVSSNAIQTTTPFTSSLSTAILPNISSHPYSPTEEPPAISLSSLVPPNQTFSSPSSSSSSSLSTTSNPKQIASTTTSLSQQATQTTSPAQSAASLSQQQQLSTLGQLYSNQHSGAGNGASSTSSIGGHDFHDSPYASQHQTSHTNRPQGAGSGGLMGLHAATKIVTGGSSGANNLIPGLSGLQSAILSHIPFKIASGLSSGLSSYLQAAMKPTGNRPLLSSNTAPSLQYQQQQALQLAQNATGGKLPSVQLAGGSGGFILGPNAQGPSTAASPNSSVRFPGGSSAVVTQTPEAAAGANATQANETLTSPRSSFDVVRDAQLVCGRPQVPPHSNPLGGLEGGKRRVARIVGGNQSLFGQWPWMVSLRQWRKGAFLHKCGAALLNENWAITAAHCVENVKASDLLLRLGEFDVSNQEEPYPYVERRVKTVVSHPSFDPKTFEYDLALLRFSEPVKYERNIVPVCVPSGNDSYVDRMATVIGWGRLYEDGPLPDVIQHVDVPIITNNECEKMYKNAGYIEEIPEMFICAGISKGGRDSCEGDSGGPLTMVDHDGRSYLVGIISWGIGCALPSQPGVYTRITAFSGWINQITAF